MRHRPDAQSDQLPAPPGGQSDSPGTVGLEDANADQHVQARRLSSVARGV